jgi:biopolymer transport protein ExbD
MQQGNHRIGDTNKSRMTFYVGSSPSSADTAQRLEAISAEVKERRERRQGILTPEMPDKPTDTKSIAPHYALEIHVQSNGAILVGDRPATEEELKQTLSAFAKEDKSRSILIIASEKVSAEALTKIMDQCRKLGLTKFVMQTSQEK